MSITAPPPGPVTPVRPATPPGPFPPVTQRPAPLPRYRPGSGTIGTDAGRASVRRRRRRLRSRRSHLALVVSLSLLGLGIQGAGFAAGRSDRTNLGLALFFAGLVVIFGAGAWRLLGPNTGRRERIQVACVLGVALAVSHWLLNPLLFVNYDELLHQVTLNQLVSGRSLFGNNTLLPVSPYYPGLELITVAIHWTTGFPLVLSQLATIVAARLVLVLVVFLVVERLTHS